MSGCALTCTYWNLCSLTLLVQLLDAPSVVFEDTIDDRKTGTLQVFNDSLLYFTQFNGLVLTDRVNNLLVLAKCCTETSVYSNSQTVNVYIMTKKKAITCVLP